MEAGLTYRMSERRHSWRTKRRLGSNFSKPLSALGKMVLRTSSLSGIFWGETVKLASFALTEYSRGLKSVTLSPEAIYSRPSSPSPRGVPEKQVKPFMVYWPAGVIYLCICHFCKQMPARSGEFSSTCSTFLLVVSPKATIAVAIAGCLRLDANCSSSCQNCKSQAS